MVFDQTGSLASVSRHDYLPFGEELYAGTGGRTAAQGYVGDSTRQHFTGYERDAENGLDYAHARYYANQQGRFTSVDPFGKSASVLNPQSFNRYSYVVNNPTNLTDPLGLMSAAPDNHDDDLPGDPFETGADITGAAEARHDRWVDIDAKGGDYGDANYPTPKGEHGPPGSGSAEEEESGEGGGKDGYAETPQTPAEETDVPGGGVNPQGWNSGRGGWNFSQLWLNHPGVQNSDAVTLCPEYARENCAIRLSVALQNSGMDMSSFKGGTCNPTTGGRAAINTGQLANWLASPKRLGRPEKFRNGLIALDSIMSRTGIVYIRQFIGAYDPGRYNHIDLWNGYRMGTGESRWITLLPKEVWFWPIK